MNVSGMNRPPKLKWLVGFFVLPRVVCVPRYSVGG